jgi:hypothetical protein
VNQETLHPDFQAMIQHSAQIACRDDLCKARTAKKNTLFTEDNYLISKRCSAAKRPKPSSDV